MSKSKKALNEASPRVSIVFATRASPPGARPTQRPRLACPPLRLTAYSSTRLHVSPVGTACQVPSRLLTHCVSNTLDERSRFFFGTEGFGEDRDRDLPVKRRSSRPHARDFDVSKNSTRKRIY